jgi:GNAT superfamily N-acetyltransferase
MRRGRVGRLPAQPCREHHRDGIATDHVLVDDARPVQILGYCALSAAQLGLHELSGQDRKRLPAYSVPAMRLGRLAVSAQAKGKGYGQLLLGHAANLAVALRQTLGIRVLIVDVKDARAAAFYAAHRFRHIDSDALTLYLPVSVR